MKIIVFGCGRVGAHLANLLSEKGHEVTVIDKDSRSFRLLKDDFKGNMILGTGIDEYVLRNSGIEETKVFAAVTDQDNINIMSCLVAKEIFNVPFVIARISDPRRESIYREFGLKTICPTIEAVGGIARILSELNSL